MRKSNRIIVITGMHYYRDERLLAVRKDEYKVHFVILPNNGTIFTPKDAPLLCNLNVDPSEKYDIADQHPGIVAEIKEIMKKQQESIVPVENQMLK